MTKENLTPEMRVRVKINDLALKQLLKAYPSDASTANLYVALSNTFREALQSVRQEAIEEATEKVKRFRWGEGRISGEQKIERVLAREDIVDALRSLLTDNKK